MIGSFTFNSIESSSFDLVCKSVKRPLLPEKKTNRIELLGASGVYDFNEDEYSLRQVTMRISYIGSSFEELRTRARQIAAWLSTKNWVKLIINDEPDKYYLAKITSEIDLNSLWESGTADIVFDCQPFALSVTESSFSFNVTGDMNCEFNNPGTREINFKNPPGSKFQITITGSWESLSLMMNGNILTYTTVGSNATLIINNIDLEATQNGSNVYNNLGGDIDEFLKIIPGVNTLTINGISLNMTVVVEFISMWM